VFSRRCVTLAASIILMVAVILSGCQGKTNTVDTANYEAVEDIDVAEQSQETVEAYMKLSSSAFGDNGNIPVKYARQGVEGGQNISIPLSWIDAPEGTKSFALAMVDVSARNWMHWMVIDIPAETTSIPEGASAVSMPAGAKELVNTFGIAGYGGPEPPPGSKAHKYVTTLYALDAEKLTLPEKPTYNEFLRIIEKRTLAEANITGLFSR